MATLTQESFKRLATWSDKVYAVLCNGQGETYETEVMSDLIKHRSKVETKFPVAKDSTNIYPFTHAALVVRGKIEVIANIKPIESIVYKTLVLEYDWND